MFQGVRFDKCAKCDLILILQRLANITCKLCLVDDNLREQCFDVDFRVTRFCELTGDQGFEGRRVQRPFHRQFDGSSWFGNAHELAPWLRVTHGDSLHFDAAEDIHDAAILQIRLVVREAP